MSSNHLGALILIGLCSTARGSGGDDATRAAGEQASADSGNAGEGDLDAWCLLWESPPIPEGEGPDSEAQAMSAILSLAEEKIEASPSEIVDPMQTHFQQTKDFVETMIAIGFELEAASIAQRERLEPNDESTAALERLDQFASDNCA